MHTRRELFKSRVKKPGMNVVIVQYEMVMSKPDLGMLKQIKWSYMVVDEGHRLKNKDSKLFTVLTKEYESRRKLILTGTGTAIALARPACRVACTLLNGRIRGSVEARSVCTAVVLAFKHRACLVTGLCMSAGTPLQNNIGELWNLLNFLLPTVFDTDADFKTWFSKPFAHSEEEDEEEASQEEQMVLINRLHQVRLLPRERARRNLYVLQYAGVTVFGMTVVMTLLLVPPQHAALLLVNPNEEIGDGWGGRHAHCYHRLLSHDEVSKPHAIVAHDDGDGCHERLGRVVAKAAEGVGRQKARRQALDTVLRADVGVHCDGIVGEQAGIGREGQGIELSLEFKGVSEVGWEGLHDGLEHLVHPLADGVG